MSRPTFFLEEEFPIRAAGIIPYTNINNQPYVLLIEKEGILEDFGGKTDLLDTSYFETAMRECYEESNHILQLTVDNTTPYWYQKNSKYITFYVKIDPDIFLADFGEYEMNRSTKRKIQWFNLSDKLLLHPRLRSKN
jgi:8-oxo-dGTP pyrophosphatase MutT (NUDIX family)